MECCTRHMHITSCTGDQYRDQSFLCTATQSWLSERLFAFAQLGMVRHCLKVRPMSASMRLKTRGPTLRDLGQVAPGQAGEFIYADLKERLNQVFDAWREYARLLMLAEMHWVHHRLLIELYDVDDQGVTDSHVGTSSSSTTTGFDAFLNHKGAARQSQAIRFFHA